MRYKKRLCPALDSFYRWSMRRLSFAVVIWLSVLFVPRSGDCSTTVVFLRHAEKATLPADDPPLSAAGKSRAKLLADVLADAGVSAIFVTQYKRTGQTAAPLAARVHVNPQVILAANNRELFQAIRKVQDGVVVVVGHSDTIPTIIAELGGPSVVIPESEFDNLFILIAAPSGTSFLRLHYGLNSRSAESLEQEQSHVMQLRFSRSGGFAGVATNVDGVVTFHDSVAEVSSSTGYHRTLTPTEAESLRQSVNLKDLRSLGAQSELRDAYQYELVVDWDDKKSESFVFHNDGSEGKTNSLLAWIVQECQRIWEYRIRS